MSFLTSVFVSLVAALMLLMCVQPSSAAVGSDKKDLIIFGMQLTTLSGQTFQMADLKDKKAILFVNVASQCGYTHSNYKMMQQLQQDYGSQGLAILAFPCNQFGLQEPGTAEEILDFTSTKYSVDFPIMAKTDVNGPGTHPIFGHLKALSGNSLNIEWNFNKFLVSGAPGRRTVTRFSHGDPLDVVVDAVKQALEDPWEEGHAEL